QPPVTDNHRYVHRGPARRQNAVAEPEPHRARRLPAPVRGRGTQTRARQARHGDRERGAIAMVSVRRDRRGASTMGCLLSLLVLVAVLYYGVNIGEVYFRDYRILDEMQAQARVAAALGNGTIQRPIPSPVQGIRPPRHP